MVSNDSSNILHLLYDFFIILKYHTLLGFSDVTFSIVYSVYFISH